MDPQDPLNPANPLRPHVVHLDKDRRFWRSKYEQFKQNTDKHKGTLVQAGEVFVGAGLAGVANGRFGGQAGAVSVGGIPVTPVIGLALLGVGMFDMLGAASSPHLINFGIGAIAEFGANFGFGMGQRWHETGHLFEFHHGAGLPAPAHASGDLSPQAINEIARSMPR